MILRTEDDYVLVIMMPEDQLTSQDIMNECRKDRWAPYATYKKDGKTIVPCFRLQQIALDFMRRNGLKEKGKLFALIRLNQEDIKVIVDRGFEFQYFEFPKVLPVNFECEIHYFVDEEIGVVDMERNSVSRVKSKDGHNSLIGLLGIILYYDRICCWRFDKSLS